MLLLETYKQLHNDTLFTLLPAEGEEREKSGTPKSLKECVHILCLSDDSQHSKANYR